MCHFSRTLCSLSVPGVQEWVELHAVLRIEIMGKGTCLDSFQWLSSVTLYVLDYPFCCNWWNFILCNVWVIILLKIYKHAVLLIKYPGSTRDLDPPCPSFCLILFGAWKPTELTFSPGLSRPPWEDALCLRGQYKSCAWALLVFHITREILLSLSLFLSLSLSTPVPRSRSVKDRNNES